MDSASIESFKLDVIRMINKHRKEHGAPNLNNDSKIDKIAQKFADQLSKKGELDYSYNQYNGEDLGESVYQSNNYMAPLKLVNILYGESADYNYKDKDPEPSNFTQMVWKSSEYIGFGMQQAKGKYYFVIDYYPTGNIDGEFQKNVFPKGTKPPVSEKPNNEVKNKENKENNNYNNSSIKNENNKKNKKKEKETVKEEYVEYEYEYTEKSSVKEKDKKMNIINQLINNINKYESHDYNEFCLDALKSHNKYRKMHHVEPLILSKDICKISEDYAKKLAIEIGHLEHSDNCFEGDLLGENLYFCGGVEPTGESVSKNWYGENRKYIYDGDWKKGTGHFTQMIWKETRLVGFGKYKNKKGQTYVVANYFPAGNVIGFFKKNIFEP